MRRIDWRIVLGFLVVNTICLFFYRQLEFVANREHYPPLLTFLSESAGALAGLAVFPLIYLAAIRFPLLSPRWRRNLGIHLVAVCLISLAHTTIIAFCWAFFFPLFGFRNVSYGYLPARYPMEFAHLFIYYWVTLGFVYLFHEIRFARERELRQAHLEASLSEAQLQNLRLQLEPHFLFNALNAISAAIYENPRVADEMVGRLSELLRQLFKNERAQQVPLVREVELLQLYTRIMEARYEHRLHVVFDIAEETTHSLVPQLILQPLVENAIRHGMDPVTFRADVTVSARRSNDLLLLSIRDRGPGLLSPTPADGIGLRNTRERLTRLYGNRQSFAMRDAADGGVVVELEFPFSNAALSAPVESLNVANSFNSF